MANPHPVDGTHNLIPLNKKDAESRKEIQRKGGLESARRRREYKSQREVAKMVLSLNARECNFDLDDVPPEVRDTITVGELMAYRQAQKALSPIALEGYDTTAWKELRNTADGTPVATVEAIVQTTSTDDIDIDQALALVQAEKPAPKPKTTKPRARKKSE